MQAQSNLACVQLIVLVFLSASLLIFTACNDKNDQIPDPDTLEIVYVYIGDVNVLASNGAVVDELEEPIKIKFSAPVDITSIEQSVSLLKAGVKADVSMEFNQTKELLTITPDELSESTDYTITITEELKGEEGERFDGLQVSFVTFTTPLRVENVTIDGKPLNLNARIIDVSLQPELQLSFNMPINGDQIAGHTTLKRSGINTTYSTTQPDEKTIIITPRQGLEGYRKYSLKVASTFASDIDRPFEGLNLDFYTKLDSTPAFPEISDDELLTKVQQQTFKYFWDFGHPVSGLARERNTSGETVTSGGSGFGVMSIVVGIERGFITRQEGVDRIETIVNFLLNNADRFHGAWSHWLSGTNGSVVPFSSKDDGGDLVETAFMVQGLLTARQYLDANDLQEATIIENINTLWQAVEWDWYTQDGQNVLYWHWSPNFEWEMNHKIQGWNEALIVYVLAAASPTHSIEKAVYEEGWARSGGMVNSNGNSFYNYSLPLRSDMGGPLFFSHYSFLGLDPRSLQDQYANYWTQNVIHSQINQAYCIENPQRYVGYKAYSWGLTASDGNNGYSAHSPNNDRGVITPTAAISSIPYTPEASLAAIRHFYYILGDRLWGEYGFYDAFNLTADWTANSYLAIDQGPIVVMIENYRTGLLWELFMSAPEIQNGLQKLDFTYE